MKALMNIYCIIQEYHWLEHLFKNIPNTMQLKITYEKPLTMDLMMQTQIYNNHVGRNQEIMTRTVDMVKFADTWIFDIAPMVKLMLEKNKEKIQGMHCALEC